MDSRRGQSAVPRTRFSVVKRMDVVMVFGVSCGYPVLSRLESRGAPVVALTAVLVAGGEYFP